MNRRALVPVLAGMLSACTWRTYRDPLLFEQDAAIGDVAIEAAGACSARPRTDAGGGLSEGLVVWYRCESATGTALPDSSGRGNDGVLASGSGAASATTFAPGKVGNGLNLVYAAKGFVTLPAGLLSNACEATIATWVYINSNVNAWTRIWDFGNDTNAYMFLTPITNIDNVARFGISVSGNQHEQQIKAQSAVPTQKWVHVALVLGPTGATLYFDGASVGSDPSITLRPLDLGRMVNNYIGRSEFTNDPYLDGNIDEFRVYDRALSPDEIRTLAAGL